MISLRGFCRWRTLGLRAACCRRTSVIDDDTAGVTAFVNEDAVICHGWGGECGNNCGSDEIPDALGPSAALWPKDTAGHPQNGRQAAALRPAPACGSSSTNVACALEYFLT
jgi:hypothetical protein